MIAFTNRKEQDFCLEKNKIIGGLFKSEGDTKLQNVQKGLTGKRMYSYFHERCRIFKCLSHPQVLLSSAALSDFFSQSILMAGIVPIQVQHPTL